MRFAEAIKMALEAIWNHKLRSFLTLIGIIAGVASIIAVMTGISVVQSTIESELSVLGTTTFQIQKWAAGGPLSEEERRKIQKRKPITIEQADAIRQRIKNADLVGSELWSFGHRLKYGKKATNSDITICGGTPEYAPNNTHYVDLGRNISNEDIRVGRSVCVIGYQIAQELFPWTDPIHKIIKLDGRKFKVVGVFEEKKSAFGSRFDSYVIMPISKFTQFYGLRDNRGRLRSVNVTVRAKSPERVQDAIDESRMILRGIRGVKPNEEDDFTVYTNDSQIKTFNQATAGVKTGAFVIGIVALIVAGIGIMNIMLVSVTERTREIGIRKSLGAKRKNILMQFLMEAIILTNIGGIIGVLVGFGLGNIVTFFTGFAANVPLEWAVVGVVFCTIVGVTFGFWPAVIAAKLDPIESLRYE